MEDLSFEDLIKMKAFSIENLKREIKEINEKMAFWSYEKIDSHKVITQGISKIINFWNTEEIKVNSAIANNIYYEEKEYTFDDVIEYLNKEYPNKLEEKKEQILDKFNISIDVFNIHKKSYFSYYDLKDVSQEDRDKIINKLLEGKKLKVHSYSGDSDLNNLLYALFKYIFNYDVKFEYFSYPYNLEILENNINRIQDYFKINLYKNGSIEFRFKDDNKQKEINKIFVDKLKESTKKNERN
jgi:hypothetical protein